MFLGEDMSIVQDVSTKEDFSVERKIKKVAKRLNSKYSKKRKVNEKLLKEHTGVKKVFLVLLNICFDNTCFPFVHFLHRFACEWNSSNFCGI